MSEQTPTPDLPTGLLLSRDLLFTSKVTSEARAQGRRILVAGNVGLATSMIEQWKPCVLFLDLAAGTLTEPAAMLAYRRLAGDTVPFIAFGSHVDTAGLAAAADAGCNLVLPRSQFTNDLPALIERYLPG